MQYEVESPKQYMKALEDDWRKEKLLEIRKFILESSEEIMEDIEYKMLGYKYQDQLIFCSNAQKNYVSLYVGDIRKVNQSKELLNEFNTGKGCIRVRKTNQVKESNIGQFIKSVIQSWKSGEDTDC